MWQKVWRRTEGVIECGDADALHRARDHAHGPLGARAHVDANLTAVRYARQAHKTSRKRRASLPDLAVGLKGVRSWRSVLHFAHAEAGALGEALERGPPRLVERAAPIEGCGERRAVRSADVTRYAILGDRLGGGGR